MKLLMTVVTLFVAAGLLGAEEAAKATTHELEVEVVFADPEARTLTVRPDPDADKLTVRVEGEAVRILDRLQSGEKVLLTCRDKDDEHKAIIRIRRNKAV